MTFETAGGKEIKAVRNVQAQWIIQFATGGQLPEELTGLYTAERYAVADIERYLEKVKDRKPKTAKE